MNTRYVASAIASLLVLAGCSSKPDCGSGSAEKLITGLVSEHNLLGNLYATALMRKQLEKKQEVDTQSSSELNKLKSDQSATNLELQNVVQQCIVNGQQSTEMTTASSDIQQLKAQINQTQSNPPQLKTPSNAEMLQMSAQQSTNVRRDAEIQYQKDQRDWGNKINLMNQNLQQMSKAFEDSGQFIKAACSLDKDNAVKFRAYPSLADKVNAFVTQTVQPVAAKIVKINESMEAINTNSRLSKEEREAKEMAKAQENIKNAKLKLEDVVTLSKNDNTGALTCRARLKIEVKDLVETKGTIYYRLEQTSKGDLYGTITQLTD